MEALALVLDVYRGYAFSGRQSRQGDKRRRLVSGQALEEATYLRTALLAESGHEMRPWSGAFFVGGEVQAALPFRRTATIIFDRRDFAADFSFQRDKIAKNGMKSGLRSG
jgi:hypothetical protein